MVIAAAVAAAAAAVLAHNAAAAELLAVQGLQGGAEETRACQISPVRVELWGQAYV